MKAKKASEEVEEGKDINTKQDKDRNRNIIRKQTI